MTSWAPNGSYTPGPNTYGSLRSSSRSRLDGCVQRDAGTTNPSGRSGVGTSSVPGVPSGCAREEVFVSVGASLIRVVPFAEVRTVAVGGLGGRWLGGCRDRDVLARSPDRQQVDPARLIGVFPDDPGARGRDVPSEVGRGRAHRKRGCSIHLCS